MAQERNLTRKLIDIARSRRTLDLEDYVFTVRGNQIDFLLLPWLVDNARYIYNFLPQFDLIRADIRSFETNAQGAGYNIFEVATSACLQPSYCQFKPVA